MQLRRIGPDDFPGLKGIFEILSKDIQKAKNRKYAKSFYPKMAVFGGSILYIMKRCRISKMRFDKDWFKLEHAESIMVYVIDLVHHPYNFGLTFSEKMLMVIERIMEFIEHYISKIKKISDQGFSLISIRCNDNESLALLDTCLCINDQITII
ncbi:hypothetical protein DFA_04688 [Cavenderia fasciculata]|uniref:Uncharacterized protein n=1 Tax=Cavenderia fasciculata TaxID=261658 RepID=F4PQ95_CACFS|nr:uncharacterized protein DFA_04688 [Cavenderia fasciculata]EGG22558.1 hypothetical protein DFA_04688 [Cavenderia fasciculata]|eukprot:XP_004360409.1 hypothetical protein DFA_04688 [Cavenderia fasciculata]